MAGTGKEPGRQPADDSTQGFRVGSRWGREAGVCSCQAHVPGLLYVGGPLGMRGPAEIRNRESAGNARSYYVLSTY